MKKSDMIDKITMVIRECTYSHIPMSSEEIAEAVLKEVDIHMEPKYGGTHQTSYSIAMGNPCEWDEVELTEKEKEGES